MYYYNDIKARTPLDKTLIKAIKNSENVQIRLYIDEDAYTITLKKHKTNTLETAS